jgi:hypothetical protein
MLRQDRARERLTEGLDFLNRRSTDGRIAIADLGPPLSVTEHNCSPWVTVSAVRAKLHTYERHIQFLGRTRRLYLSFLEFPIQVGATAPTSSHKSQSGVLAIMGFYANVEDAQYSELHYGGNDHRHHQSLTYLSDLTLNWVRTAWENAFCT